MLMIDILQSTCMEKLRCNELICNKINELVFKCVLYTIVTY